MICDLVGSTALSARLDPEDMRAVIDAYHAACARITRTYDGFLAEFRGDGILAYFGYPLAHEDDAERTVRPGPDIIAAVAQLETRAAEPLAVRIGIATGLVVIGDLRSAIPARTKTMPSEPCGRGSGGGVQGRRCARAKARQTRSDPRHGCIAGSSCGDAFCGAALDPVRRTICAAGAHLDAATPPNPGGTARSNRGSRAAATDPAL